MELKTFAYGFPRLGENREYKKAIESYWKKEITLPEMQEKLEKLEREILDTYKNYVDIYPVGEMTCYDNMLDTAIIFGVYKPCDLDEYFELCRGKNALEMTKWFNTNYHYLVPDFTDKKPEFTLFWNKQIEHLVDFQSGIPYIIGPFTFIKLSKGIPENKFGDYLLSVAKAYKSLFDIFPRIIIDEPAFVLELTDKEIELIKETYNIIKTEDKEIFLLTYYDSVDFLSQLFELPVKGIGLDFVNGKENFKNLQKIGFPDDKILIAGVINGRNVWKANLKEKAEFIEKLNKIARNIIISNGAPLYHLPVRINEPELPAELVSRLSFAIEKLEEIKKLKQILTGEIEPPEIENSKFGEIKEVKEKIKNLKEEDFKRTLNYSERIKIQQERLKLPLFPTTTIGSFPQTKEVRKKRAEFKKNQISQEEYDEFIKKKIKELIKIEEEVGLDVFVHGEFERSDMVEFFAEKLDGIATTRNGWIISYGTRVYRPPIIYGDISRPQPMTIKEISYAQSLTDKPVKGMITGPVTIVAWSFVREDIPVEEVAYQIALCIREEIKDYEKNNIKIVQVDEPAFREKAPIKKRHWNEYFNWAVKAFNLAVSSAKPETQIHSHMCYSEFGEIIDQIKKLEFDVISIEATRSKGDIIESFEKVKFEKQIGLGVWDIHSPVVPSIEKMKEIIDRALKVIPPENFWINPDCGLKTRGWEETIPSLKNLVKVAREYREKYGKK